MSHNICAFIKPIFSVKNTQWVVIVCQGDDNLVIVLGECSEHALRTKTFPYCNGHSQPVLH